MKKWIRNVAILSLLVSFNGYKGSAESKSYEVYGETGFYGQYQNPVKENTGLTAEEKNYFLTQRNDKIPSAGDEAYWRYIVLSVFPLFLGSLVFFKLCNEKKQNIKSIKRK